MISIKGLKWTGAAREKTGPRRKREEKGVGEEERGVGSLFTLNHSLKIPDPFLFVDVRRRHEVVAVPAMRFHE